jgi:hypothetical protein
VSYCFERQIEKSMKKHLKQNNATALNDFKNPLIVIKEEFDEEIDFKEVKNDDSSDNSLNLPDDEISSLLSS